MGNGFTIDITENDFKSKDQAEQNWLLFQGMVASGKRIEENEASLEKLHGEGCAYGQARERHKVTFLQKLTAISAGVMGILAAAWIIFQATCK
jgi:hypothetical protein